MYEGDIWRMGECKTASKIGKRYIKEGRKEEKEEETRKNIYTHSKLVRQGIVSPTSIYTSKGETRRKR
jgi:hypothetical protein